MNRLWVAGLSAFLTCLGTAELSVAQDNTLMIERKASGNTLSVARSGAGDGTVGGLELPVANAPIEVLGFDAARAARRVARNNCTKVVVGGEERRGGLAQADDRGDADNVAAITGGALPQSAVDQPGSGDRTAVSVTGDLGGRDAVPRRGDGSTGFVALRGGGSGTLVQNGNDSNRGLNVAGDTDVGIVQNDSGLTDAASNAAIASAIARTGRLPAGLRVTRTALPVGAGSR